MFNLQLLQEVFVNDNVKLLALHVLGWNMNKVYAYLDTSEVLGAIYYIVCICFLHFLFYLKRSL